VRAKTIANIGPSLLSAITFVLSSELQISQAGILPLLFLQPEISGLFIPPFFSGSNLLPQNAIHCFGADL
jgi:hypothetical protein